MLRRGQVLIVEDDESVARFLTRALREEYDIAHARNGQEALDRITAGERYDLILCDLQMPQMTGVDFLMNLDELAADQVSRIVFLTGNRHHPMAQLVTGHLLMDKATDCGEIRALATKLIAERHAA